jgi:predicted transcriptional regulator of viral defense system
MHIQDIRAKTPREEIDYLFLKDCLKEYAQPRNKIQALLKSKGLIRVKKGLYVFGYKAARGPYSKEVLANLIYGPSAISLEYALSFYGLIPERVEEVTCVTPKRNKQFQTPIGSFGYHYLRLDRYPIGITQQTLMGDRKILIATKEKALCDMLCLKCHSLKKEFNLKQYLFEDLRIEEDFRVNFNKALLELIEYHYQHPNISLFLKYIKNKRA